MKHCDISLLNSCNFSCGYCKSSSQHVRKNNEYGIHDVNSPIIDSDFLIKFVQDNLEGYVIQLSGGEPLTHPSIGYIIREISKTNKVIVCTNGSLLKVHERLLKVKNVLWRISYHPEYRKDNFNDIIKIVHDNKVPYIINYVLHPRHIESKKYIEYISEIEDYKFEITEFEGFYKDKFYRLFDNVYDGIRSEIPLKTFELEMVTVRPNGLVYTCHGRVVPIGDVYNNTFKNETCKATCMLDNISLCPTYGAVKRMFLNNEEFFKGL